jgi:hypothetical protein
MLIKNLSASVDLDSTSMRAVRGGLLDLPGPPPPPEAGPIGPTNSNFNPQVVTNTYDPHEYYHAFPIFRR